MNPNEPLKLFMIYKPIINSTLDVKLKICDSEYHYGIQSVDIMSHYLHSQYKNILQWEKRLHLCLVLLKLNYSCHKKVHRLFFF